jgi:hypothetical protein
VNPSEWVTPRPRDNEDAESYKTRLAEWNSKRARVAKRLGVKVVAATVAAAKK